jgi:MinD-like ATPase involved in chromosome partitioning or flagellar assembly
MIYGGYKALFYSSCAWRYEMEKILAVIAEDPIYTHTLCDYICNSHILEYKVVEFYCIDEYEVFQSMNRIEIALVDEKFYSVFEKRNENYVFCLTNDRTDRSDAIFMYQSMDIIIKDIVFRIRTSGAIKDTYQFDIYSVIGTKGGSGATTFTKALALAIGKQKNVLLLSLDPFIGTIDRESTNEVKELVSEVLYNLKIHGAGWLIHSDNSIGHASDFDYIVGASTFEDINDIGKEEMRSFFAGIAEDGRYQAVVVDIGNFPLCSSVVLEKSKKIFLVCNDDEENSSTIEKQLKRIFDEGITEKEARVKLPYESAFVGRKPGLKEIEDSKITELALNAINDNRELIDEHNLMAAEDKGELIVRENNGYQQKKRKWITKK